MKTEIRTCPKCSKTYSDRPALSRVDNQTLICTDCSIREALYAIGVSVEEQEKILSIIHRNCSS